MPTFSYDLIVDVAGPGGVLSTAVDVVGIQLGLFNSTRVIKGDIFSNRLDGYRCFFLADKILSQTRPSYRSTLFRWFLQVSACGRETRVYHSFRLVYCLPRLNDSSCAPKVSPEVYGGAQIQFAYRGHSASHESNSPVDG